MKVQVVLKRKGKSARECKPVEKTVSHDAVTWEESYDDHPATRTGMPSQGSCLRRGERPGRY